MGQVSFQGIRQVVPPEYPSHLSPMYPVYFVTYLSGSDPQAVNPRPQPPAEEPQLSVREQCERDWHRLNEYYKAQKAQGVTR
jgi:hypothetical protein